MLSINATKPTRGLDALSGTYMVPDRGVRLHLGEMTVGRFGAGAFPKTAGAATTEEAAMAWETPTRSPPGWGRPSVDA